MNQLTEEQKERVKQIRARAGGMHTDVAFLLSMLDGNSQAAGPEALASVNASAREIVEVVNKTGISLAVCRHGLIREGEDDETVLPDGVEDEIIQDVLKCLTGEETGCLDPEELDAENCAVLMVQDRLNRTAIAMRDKCEEEVRALAESWEQAAYAWHDKAQSESRPDIKRINYEERDACLQKRDAANVIANNLSSLTLDQVKPEK